MASMAARVRPWKGRESIDPTATPEAKEGLDAFLSKRPAAWVPRG